LRGINNNPDEALGGLDSVSPVRSRQSFTSKRWISSQAAGNSTSVANLVEKITHDSAQAVTVDHFFLVTRWLWGKRTSSKLLYLRRKLNSRRAGLPRQKSK